MLVLALHEGKDIESNLPTTNSEGDANGESQKLLIRWSALHVGKNAVLARQLLLNLTCLRFSTLLNTDHNQKTLRQEQCDR